MVSAPLSVPECAGAGRRMARAHGSLLGPRAPRGCHEAGGISNVTSITVEKRSRAHGGDIKSGRSSGTVHKPRESVMSKMSSKFSIRTVLTSLAVAGSLTIFAQAANAYTSEQRIACTPDAFRLCSSEIPNIDGITACMRKQKSSLSAACKAVFDK